MIATKSATIKIGITMPKVKGFPFAELMISNTISANISNTKNVIILMNKAKKTGFSLIEFGTFKRGDFGLPDKYFKNKKSKVERIGRNQIIFRLPKPSASL